MDLFSIFASCNLLRWVYILQITLSRDVELNPGLKRNATPTFSICHWNLNSTCTHNFGKFHLLRTYPTNTPRVFHFETTWKRFLQDDCATFSDNFEMTLDLDSKEHRFLFVVLGDFNFKLSQWHNKDCCTSEEISVESIMQQFGLHQIINEPIHIFRSSSSHIDLIFI